MRKATCCVMRENVRERKKGRDRQKRREGRYKIRGSHDLLKTSRVHPVCHIYFPHICLWVNDVYQ